ncbi:MAG: GNAT family N-acetyltransferase [Bacteroidota bacterium]
MKNINNDIVIKEITEFSELFYIDAKELLSQLTSAEINFSTSDFERIVSSENSIFFAAFNKEVKDKIVGILILVIVDIPTGMLARIEDVVVDSNVRGKGIGEKIILVAIQKAKELGIKKVDLTSNPKREAANRLYQRIGFQQRETNVYRYEL